VRAVADGNGGVVQASLIWAHMDSDGSRPGRLASLLNVDIRLIQGFVRTVRKSGMAMVVSFSTGVGRPVGGGRWRVRDMQLSAKIEL
jgi:hypothetical protein